MKCKEIEILIPDFISGIESEFDAELKHHLINCKSCNDLKINLEKTFNVLNTHKLVAEPNKEYFINFLPRIREKIDLIEEKKYFGIIEFAKSFAVVFSLLIMFNILEPTNNKSDFVESVLFDDEQVLFDAENEQIGFNEIEFNEENLNHILENMNEYDFNELNFYN